MPVDEVRPVSFYAYVDQDMERGELHEIASGVAGVFSARCPEKRSANEDSAALIPVDAERGVLAIADGFGGQPGGDQASKLALEVLRDSIQQARAEEKELRGAILNGFENANRAISELGIGAATTLTVVEIQGNTVRSYHAGDSMILVVGQRGKIKLQTVSHSPVGYAVEAGMLGEREAMHHEDRHLVSNMVGSTDMRIEIGPVLTLCPRDTVLLASDGLFDNLHVEEIVRYVRKGPLDEVLGVLAGACGRRMRASENGNPSKPDDLTSVMFRLCRRIGR